MANHVSHNMSRGVTLYLIKLIFSFSKYYIIVNVENVFNQARLA
jgi:hypothetical protein